MIKYNKFLEVRKKKLVKALIILDKLVSFQNNKLYACVNICRISVFQIKHYIQIFCENLVFPYQICSIPSVVTDA